MEVHQLREFGFYGSHYPGMKKEAPVQSKRQKNVWALLALQAKSHLVSLYWIVYIYMAYVSKI